MKCDDQSIRKLEWEIVETDKPARIGASTLIARLMEARAVANHTLASADFHG
jgi:hypothetical protein